MRVLVTGGTGLLGNTIMRKLAERGDEIVALVRSEPAAEVVDSLNAELVFGDLSSPEEPDSDSPAASQQNDTPPDAKETSQQGSDPVDDVIAQCDAVIHSAALIHLGWTRLEESMQVNGEGTRRIVDACLRHKKKLVHIGTVNTLGLGSRDTIADETTPLGHAGGQVECAYVVSKRASNDHVRRAVAKGLNAVIMHPGFMLGPWDWKPSSGRMMLEVAKGWKPLAPSGGCSLCDSRDVASGIVSALDKDLPPGREFILAGHNWTYLKLWTEMAQRVGQRPPLRAAGPGLQFLAGMTGDIWTRLSGKEPDVNSAGVTMSSQYHWYASNRAMDELGYQIRDASETLDDAGTWIRERFILPEKQGED